MTLYMCLYTMFHKQTTSLIFVLLFYQIVDNFYNKITQSVYVILYVQKFLIVEESTFFNVQTG